jgi:periplasmic divalent cation tolerance protein
MEAIIVFTTVPDDGTRVKIASQLIDKRLAACVHSFSAGTSLYRWQGKIETALEQTLMIKTQSLHVAAIDALIRECHPYDIPEILVIPVIGGHAKYLEWIMNETAAD